MVIYNEKESNIYLCARNPDENWREFFYVKVNMKKTSFRPLQVILLIVVAGLFHFLVSAWESKKDLGTRIENPLFESGINVEKARAAAENEVRLMQEQFAKEKQQKELEDLIDRKVQERLTSRTCFVSNSVVNCY